MTESLLPIVGRAVTAAAGPFVRKKMAQRTARHASGLLEQYVPSALGAVVTNLEEEERTELINFLTSVELERFIFHRTQFHLLEVAGARPNVDEVQILDQLSVLLKPRVPNLTPKNRRNISETLLRDIDIAIVGQMSDSSITSTEWSAQSRARLAAGFATATQAALGQADWVQDLAELRELQEFEQEYLKAIGRSCERMSMPHAGNARRISFDRLYVQPPISRTLPDKGNGEVDGLLEMFEGCSRAVLMGDPGGGKTTSSKRLVNEIRAGKKTDQFRATTVFLIELREYFKHYQQGSMGICEYLSLHAKTHFSITVSPDVIERCLSSGRAMVIMDGLDEVLKVSDRRTVTTIVEGFVGRYPSVPTLVTTRRVGYDEAPLDEALFQTFTLGDFSPADVEAYVNKWFALEDSLSPPQRTIMARAFMEDSRVVEDVRSNPLMLSLMCVLYATERYIPKNRPEVYEKCTTLLFDTWDRHRGIATGLPFDAHVPGAIQSLALWMYSRPSSDSGAKRAEMVKHVGAYLLGRRYDSVEESEHAAGEFVDFCRGRAWVLTDLGQDAFAFTHRTFLEYFTAKQLILESADPAALSRIILPHVRDAEWDMVCQLCVQLASAKYDDGTNAVLNYMLKDVERSKDEDEQYRVLSFVARCLAFAVPRPAVLEDFVFKWCDAVPDADALPTTPRRSSRSGARDLSSCSKENLPRLVQPYGRWLEYALPTKNSGLIGAVMPHAILGLGHQDLDKLEDFANIHRGALLAAAPQHPWMSSHLLRRRWVSVKQILEWHGGEPFFCYYEILPNNYYLGIIEGHLRAEINAPTSAAARTGSLVEVREALLSARKPWLAVVPDASQRMLVFPIGEFSEAADRSTAWRDLAMMLILVVAEIVELGGTFEGGALGIEPERFCPDLLRASSDSRLIRQDVSRRIARALKDMEPTVAQPLSKPVSALWQEWSNGRVSLVTGQGRQ